MHEVPPVGGETVFSSMYAAYEALSPRMKQMLDGLTARHDGAKSYLLLRGVSDVPAYRDGHPEAVHPVVIRHHGSDRPALFVNREFTDELNDLPQGESEALLKFLFDHTKGADFQCRFRWSPNAVAIWDNHGIQHYATFDYWPQVRTGRLAGVCSPVPKMWRLEEAPSWARRSTQLGRWPGQLLQSRLVARHSRQRAHRVHATDQRQCARVVSTREHPDIREPGRHSRGQRLMPMSLDRMTWRSPWGFRGNRVTPM